MRARINNFTEKIKFKLHGTNAYTLLNRDQGDPSNICQYKWYGWCYFQGNKEKFPFNQEFIGPVIGPAKVEGNDMDQCLLKTNGTVVPRRIWITLNVAEIHSPVKIKKIYTFDFLIERIRGNSMTPPKTNEPEIKGKWEEYEYENKYPRTIPEIEDTLETNGRLINQQSAYEWTINSEVILLHGNDLQYTKLIQISIGPYGTFSV